MLYLGSRNELRPVRSEWLSLEPIDASQNEVARHFDAGYHVYFVGAHTGCSCGFPHALAEEVIEYFEGMFESSDSLDRSNDLQSVRELLAVLDESLRNQPDCVLVPVWNGDEPLAMKGDVRWHRSALVAERFILTEQFRYRVEIG